MLKMSCRIDRDQDGKILKVYDPSGQESVLYKELLSVPGNTPESALEQYISTLEDPTIEFKKIPINMGLTSHMFVLGDEKIGTIRTKPYRDGVKVDQALVTESYRGQGIGTELYLETIRNLMAEGQKLYSDTSRTAPAERIWQKLVDLGLAFKNEDGVYETVLVEGVTPETTIDEVINRINSTQENDNINFQRTEPSSESEAVLQAVGDKMLENSVVDSFRLLSNEEIIDELVRRGISPDTAAEIAEGRGTNQKELSDNGLTLSTAGFFHNGEVFINKDVATTETVIHEFSHPYISKLKTDNPALYNEGIEKLKTEGQAVIDWVKERQPDLTGDALLEEALVQAVGEVGNNLLNAERSKGLLDWIERFWNSLKEALGLSNYSIEEVRNMTLNEYAQALAIDSIRGSEVALEKGVASVRETVQKYKRDKKIKSAGHPVVKKLDSNFSREMATEYEKIPATTNSPEVVRAYEALERETLEQYDYIVAQGVTVERWQGKGEPYANSTEMLNDLRKNNHLYFLPNSEAFGSEGVDVEGRLGLKPTTRTLDDGYKMTLSEVFRVVHDYFGHGLLGNQFGAIGEENATLQHLDLYSSEALPAVIFQTRGQNSWVNFSGVNNEAKRLMSEANKENDPKKLEEAQKMFTFAEPKDNIFSNLYNFKKYDTVRRIREQREIEQQETYLDPRGKHENINTTEVLTRVSKASSGRYGGLSRRSVQRTQSLGGHTVNVIGEYTFDESVSSKIKNAFPDFKGTQKIYEITDGDAYQKLLIEKSESNRFKACVTVHSAEVFSNMRLFVTEDGSTGVTLTKDGFLGGAFSDPSVDRPNNLAQLMLVGIKEGAITAEAFDTVLPDYYADFGFKAVSKTAFNEEYAPSVANGALADWDYETYKYFNNGRPDVVFMIYDGGDRSTIEDRLAQFDKYKTYQKHQVESYDKEGYDQAYNFMEISAINRGNYEMSKESSPYQFVTETFKQEPESVSFRVDGQETTSYREALQLGQGRDIEVGVVEDGQFQVLEVRTSSLNPTSPIGLVNSLVAESIVKETQAVEYGQPKLEVEGTDPVVRVVNEVIVKETALENGMKAEVAEDGTFEIESLEVQEDSVDKQVYDNVYDRLFGKPISEGMFIETDSQLSQKIFSFLEKLGFSVVSLENYKKRYAEKNGVEPNAEALIDLANQVIAFKEGRITEEALTEEFVHLILEGLPQDELTSLLDRIHETKEWADHSETYMKVYKNDEALVRKEILGKAIANRLQTREFNQGVFAEIWQKIKDFVNNILRPGLDSELDGLTDRVHDLLVRQDASSLEDLSKRKFRLYRIDNTMRDLVETAVKQIEEGEMQLKNSGSDKYLIAEAYQNLEQKHLELSVVNMLDLARRQTRYVKNALETSQINNTLLTGEERIVANNLKNVVQPIISKVRTEAESNPKLSKYLDYAKEVSDEISMLDTTVSEELADTIIDDIFKSNPNLQNEERDGMSFRDYYRKAFKVAESDTNFLFSIIGSIAHAKDALLEMLTHILKTMTTRAQFKFHDDALEFNRVLREAGLKPKDLTQFYDKDGFMLSYWDWVTHKKKLNEAKEETLKEIGFDYGDTFDPNKNYLEDMTPEQRSEYSEKLSKKRRNFENRKFNENFYKKMEDKMESLNLSQKTKDRLNAFNLERAHIMRDVKRDSKQRPIFTRIDIEALEAYNIERRRAKSFYDSEGNLKSGIEVHSTEQPNSLLVGGLYYTLRPGADDSSTIAFEMTKYDQANIPVTSHRGISQFLDVLRGMEIGQAKAFVKANINMNPVYEEFEPEDVPPGKELAYEVYKKLSAQRRALLNRYRDPKNSTNFLFHQMDKATQRKVRELTEDISVQRKLIDFQYDPEAEQTTEYGVNQAYNNWVREEGLAGNLELHIEKALKHVPMHQKAYLNSLFNSIELMQRGYAVSKLEQNRLTREFGEDFDISSLSLEDIQAEKLRAIEKRLAPYFMSHTPIGMNSSIESLDNARDVDELIAKLEEMDNNPDLSLSMHYSYYEDNSADLNPDYNQNYKGGPIQPKDVNKEFESKLGLSAGSYTLDEYGVPVMKNGYPEPKLLPAYRALIMTNYKSLELQNEAGNVNLYQAPQVSKTSTDKIMSVLGGKSSLIETASEYIRELKEFRIDDLAIGEVDKNGEALAKQGIRVVPRRFVRPLENTSDVTDDLFFSMMLMLKESHLHKARKESLNQVLVLEQAANNRKYNNTNKQAQSTNTVKMMKSFIDNNIFGISEVANYKVNLPFVGTVDLAKVSKILHKYVRDRNLAYNLIVPMTSWVTAEVGLMIEGWVNQYIDADSVSSARKELARLTPNALTESLDVVKTSKLSMIAERFDLFNIQQSYENAKYGVGIRALGKLGYMGHTAGNYSPIMTAMLSSLIGHRLYNGQFLDYEDFKKQVRASRNLSSKEAKAEWNSLSDKTFYNYIQAGDGKYSLDYDKFERDTGLTREEATDILNRSEIDLAIKTQKISEIIDGNIRPEERSIAQRHFLLSFLTTHKGWMSIALARRFKNGHYSTSTNKWEEGHYMTAFRAARILLKDVVEAKGNPTKIKEQILKDWINANPVERTNMRRMLIEMGTLSALYMLYLMMVGFADDDENQDNSSIQFTAYIMERLVNETRSSQIGIGGEILNTIQDPVVGFKELRKTFEISKLFDSDEVESGRYKGLSGTSSWLLNTIPGGKSMHTIYSGENIYYQRNAYRLYNSPDELQPLSLLIDSEDVKEMFGN